MLVHRPEEVQYPLLAGQQTARAQESPPSRYQALVVADSHSRFSGRPGSEKKSL